MPDTFGGNRGKNIKRFLGPAQQQHQRGAGTARSLTDLLLARLRDPTGSARKFQSFLGDSTRAAAAPILRQFGRQQDVSVARTASRFGGNASTEENRVRRNLSDDTSRNLSEVVAGQAATAAGLGAAADQRTLQGQGQVAGQQLSLQQLILQAILGQKQKGSLLGKILGAAAGGVSGFALGGPPGAAAGAASSLAGANPLGF